MPVQQHQLPSKIYYLDRFGNMSTSSSLTSSSVSSTSTSSTSSAGVVGIGGQCCRKQILPLKPKQSNSYVQHLEIKGKDLPSAVPVTMLELKKKERMDKNVVTTLTYRKPSSLISSSSSSSSSSTSSSDQQHQHHHHLMNMMNPRRPGSPSSSGYDTDSLVDQENCDVFSNLLNSTFAFSSGVHNHHQMVHHHHHDMLHSHPIWSPQPNNNNNNSLMLMGGANGNYFSENDNNNKFLVQ